MTNLADVKNYVLRRKGVGEKIGPIEDHSETGLTVIRSDKTLPESPDFVFRWGCTATVPRREDTIFVNSASAIHWAYDKRGSRKAMADAGFAPDTWTDFGDLLDDGESIWGEPCKFIVRPEHHIRSLDLNVCSSIQEVYHACQKYEKYYISEFIPKDKEWRVFVVSGRVAAVVEKIPENPNDVSWGCVEQGQFRYVPWTEWPLFVTQKAVDAFLMSGLDFGAVDVVSRSTGLLEPNAWVLEINTAPELTPYYIKTMTKCFDYIVQNGKGMLPIINTGDFKGSIHPAVSNMAETQTNV